MLARLGGLASARESGHAEPVRERSSSSVFGLILVLGAAHLSSRAAAEEAPAAAKPAPITVDPSDPQVKRLEKAFFAMFDVVIPCVQKKTAAGVPEDKLESACMCENRATIQQLMKTMAAVFKKRPQWRGHALQYKEKKNKAETTLTPRDPAELDALLQKCE